MADRPSTAAIVAGAPLDATLVPLPIAVRRHAVSRPRAIAVRALDATLTFAALLERADAVAAGLAGRGIGPGDRVAFVGRSSAAAIALLVGIGRAGATAVPLGARLASPEVAVAIEESDPGLFVVGRRPAVGGEVPVATMDELEAGGRLASPPSIRISPGDAAVVVMTSGTTGRPKGALLAQAAMAASAAAWIAALPPATGWLLCLDLGHVAGLGVAWRALGAGVPLTITDGFRPAEVLASLAGPDGPSHLSLVPVQLARLLDESAGVPVPAGVRAVLLGGAPIPPALVERALAAGWPVVPSYGLTEAGSGVTALSTREAADAPGSAGRPLPGVELRIVAAGADGVGEIEVRSPGLFAGYLLRPEASADALTDDGFLRTGDLGRVDSAGRLIVADRRDDLLVSGGENVYPAEVEAVLVAHPAVADAAVVGRRDERWGQVPVAVIVVRAGTGPAQVGPAPAGAAAAAPAAAPRGTAAPTDAELAAFCRERLASFKVPVAFLRVAELPRTPGGKLRRAEAWAIARTGAGTAR